MSKLVTFCRLVATPHRYPLLARRIKSLLTGKTISHENSAAKSFSLCQKAGVSTPAALKELGIACEDPQALFASEFESAQQRVDECPQEMGGPGNKTLLFSLVKGSKAKKVIETGVAYGWSSLAILMAIRESGGGHLYSSNLHYREYDGDEQYVGCAVPASLREHWTLFPIADAEAVPKILSQTDGVDLVHYDSAKSYQGRMATYPLLWSALNVGGLFVSDDIDDNVGFFHFCRMLNVQPIVVETPREGKPSKYVGIIQKTDSREPRDLVF